MGHGEAHRLHPRQQGGRRRRAAGVHVHLVVQGASRGIFGDHGEHGRRGAEVGDSLLPQQPPDLGGLQRPQTHVGAACRGNGPGEAPAVAVEHRQRPQVPGARAQPGVIRHRRGLQVRAPVVVHHALGPPRRAAGVVDRQQLALVGRHVLGRPRVADPLLVGVTGPVGDEARQAGPVGQATGAVGKLAGRHQHRRARVIQQGGHLIFRQPGVQRNEHGAHHRHRVVQFQHHVAVGAQRGDPVLMAHSPRRQRAAQPAAPFGHVAIGEPALAVHDRGPVGEDRGRAVEERGGRQRGEGELCHLNRLPRVIG